MTGAQLKRPAAAHGRPAGASGRAHAAPLIGVAHRLDGDQRPPGSAPRRPAPRAAGAGSPAGASRTLRDRRGGREERATTNGQVASGRRRSNTSSSPSISSICSPTWRNPNERTRAGDGTLCGPTEATRVRAGRVEADASDHVPRRRGDHGTRAPELPLHRTEIARGHGPQQRRRQRDEREPRRGDRIGHRRCIGAPCQYPANAAFGGHSGLAHPVRRDRPTTRTPGDAPRTCPTTSPGSP
jgi:hypothetical protein